jgi:hypothetical protein
MGTAGQCGSGRMRRMQRRRLILSGRSVQTYEYNARRIVAHFDTIISVNTKADSHSLLADKSRYTVVHFSSLVSLTFASPQPW